MLARQMEAEAQQSIRIEHAVEAVSARMGMGTALGQADSQRDREQQDDAFLEEDPPRVPIPPARPSDGKVMPIALLVVGMAGSGKTSLMQRLNAHSHAAGFPPYVVNLDPAVKHLPYVPNIDIRDTVKYRDVMKQYGLGPNGGIMTALNLFATRFDKVLNIIEKRAEQVRHVFVDTPGQIEVFTWSASGNIITETLAGTVPTVILYVIDTPRCASPVTFMSNMMYACSILYKTRLPFVIAFNKSDAQDPSFAFDWMKDFEAFQEALDEAQDPQGAARRRAEREAEESELRRSEDESQTLSGADGKVPAEEASEEPASGGGGRSGEGKREGSAAAPRSAVIAGEEGRAAARNVEVPADDGYILQLTRSMSLVLDEFYQGLRYAGVSAMTGDGVNELLDKINEAG